MNRKEKAKCCNI